MPLLAAATVGLLPFRTRATPSIHQGLAEVAVLPGCPLFPAGARAQGLFLTYCDVVEERLVGGLGGSRPDSRRVQLAPDGAQASG